VANIATVATAAILRRELAPGWVTGRALLRAMTRRFGSSYYVPAWSYNDYTYACAYTQHGEKWFPHGVAGAWKRYGRSLEAIWVRWYDSGDDHDTIFRYDAGGYRTGVKCRYAFDAVRVSGELGLNTQAAGQPWRLASPGLWEARVVGSYLAANDRCDLGDRPLHPSRTTPVRAQTLGPRELLRWAADEMPASLVHLESNLLSQAACIQFFWRRRMTRVYRPRGERWWRWCLDDWDNCADPGWLADTVVQGRISRHGRPGQAQGGNAESSAAADRGRE
jgi:hypothetical protein